MLKQRIPSRAGVPAVVGYLHRHHAMRLVAQDIPDTVHPFQAICHLHYPGSIYLAPLRSPCHVDVVLHCKGKPAERLDVLPCCMKGVHSSGFCQHLQHRSLSFASSDVVSSTAFLVVRGSFKLCTTGNWCTAMCQEVGTAVQTQRTVLLSREEKILRQEDVSAISSTASAY